MSAASNSAHREAARALLESVRLKDAELERHLECALSVEYWRALVPDLSVGRTTQGSEAQAPLSPEPAEDLADRFAREGVIQTAPLLDAELVLRMRAGILALMRADWPPVFAWVFDEFWRAPRIEPLRDLLARILGDGYRQTRHVWTHVVPGRRGSSGWKPHVDYRGADARLTVWIALSDATVENGCMCVIPKHLVPEAVTGRWHDLSNFDKRDVMDLLHASRPLPVRAGAVLGWDAGLMHWGSARQSSGDPRVSYSMEFAPASSDGAIAGPTFPVDRNQLPSFHERLLVVANAIGMYQHGDPRAVRYAGLAERLQERLDRG